MLNTWDEEREEGFSLVELLVVIVIIGILSAIAIGAFLNQRKKANDASVESDMRNVAIAIETALVDNPNATSIKGSNIDQMNALGGSTLPNVSIASIAPNQIAYNLASDAGNNNSITISVDGKEIPKVNLSEGVLIHIDTSDMSGNTSYTVKGWHDNGKSYVDETPLTYDSGLGGFTDDKTPVAMPGGSGEEEDENEEENTSEGGYNDLERYTILVSEITDEKVDKYGDGFLKDYNWTGEFEGKTVSSSDIEKEINRESIERFDKPELVSLIGSAKEFATFGYILSTEESCIRGGQDLPPVSWTVEDIKKLYDNGGTVYYDRASGSFVDATSMSVEELKNDTSLGGSCNKSIVRSKEGIGKVVDRDYGGDTAVLAQYLYDQSQERWGNK